MANYPKSKKGRKRVKKTEELASMEDKMAQLAMFEDLMQGIIPELQEALVKGITPKELAKKYEAYAMARAISIAMTETDSGKALAAAKEIQDRASGRPTETKKIQHEMQDLPEEQLDAILRSEVQGLNKIMNSADEEDMSCDESESGGESLVQ